jgi:hypothetical protein
MMAGSSTSIPEAAEALRMWLLEGGANVGAVNVVDADVVWDEDAEGEPILRFLVTLVDPTEETWPIGDVLEFHRRVDSRAVEIGLEAPWYVGLETQTQDELDPADAPV